MRNFLIFQDLSNKNYINNMDKIYIKFKNTYNDHQNELNNYKKNINKETLHFKNLSNDINNDFKKYQNNLNNTNLTQQYITIINNTDNHYLEKLNTLEFKIHLHKIDTNIFIKLLGNITRNLKKYKINLYKLNNFINTLKYKKNNKPDKFKKSVKKLILYQKICNNSFNNCLNNIFNNTTTLSNNKTINEINNIDTLEKLSSKINNLNNVILKNNKVMHNLKQQINTEANNSNNPNHIDLLKILYDNCVKNDILFQKKLNIYYIKINNITNTLDNTNTLDSLDVEDIKTEIINNSDVTNKKNVIYLLKKKLIENQKKLKINKFENLIAKLKSIKY